LGLLPEVFALMYSVAVAQASGLTCPLFS